MLNLRKVKEWYIRMDRREVVERIGFLRGRAMLSARALSLMIGKTDSYVNRMEQNGFEPSLSTLLEIIDACGSNTEEFFYHDITKYKEEKATIDFLATLTEKQLQAIRNLY